MNRKNAKKAIAKIAKREGITKTEVRKEMRMAIMAGYRNIAARGKWNELFGKDTIPSPEEFILRISKTCMH